MDENILAKLFEHNHWANLQIIQACSTLSDAQLDAEPGSATLGCIRKTLLHLVSSQRAYLMLLTVPVEERRHFPYTLEFNQLRESAIQSGEGLIAMVRDWPEKRPKERLLTTDDFSVEPWVLLIQIINHASEHREQIKSMLTALGVTPPDTDGWSYGVATGALIQKPD